jgi:photosystem II stability/assembly factor-like uncharacterized protein
MNTLYSSSVQLTRRAVLAWCAAGCGTALAAPVGPALERAALAVRSPERGVLLGAARAGQRIVAVGERGLVVLSDDGGRGWRQAPVPVSVTLTAVRFAGTRHGYAVGHGGVVLATADGGESWSLRLEGRALAQLALRAAHASGVAARVQDAERLVADGPDKPLLDLEVFGEQRVLAVGAYGLAVLTEDGGRSWAPWMARLDNPKGLHLYAVRRHGDQLLLSGEQGLALLSADTGRSFRRLALPYGGTFFTGEFAGPSTLVLAGLRGNVWQSADGGAGWQKLPAPVPASLTASAVRSDGTVLLANQAGLVLGLRGGALAPLPGGPLPPVNALLPLDNTVLALTVQGAMTLPVAAAQ